jgi:amino acid adenylation domain-containing protein
MTPVDIGLEEASSVTTLAASGRAESSYPLAPIQRGMLYHWLRDPRSGRDVEQILADLREEIDPARFEAAWSAVVESFDTLRTAFIWDGPDAPVQRVVPNATLDVRFTDLRACDAGDREQRLQAYLASDRHAGFDLSIAPAMRVALFQFGDAHFRMVWSFHHILLDGRSFALILNRVFAVYERAPISDVSPRPFRDYIDWVEAQDVSESRTYWKETLRGFTATTPLPFDVPRSGAAEARERETALPLDTTRRLRELGAREEFSLNTIVMAAWALVLARHSGETDIVFGSTKTTRQGSIPDADKIVGQFLATVPVRVTVDPDVPVREWLKRVRAQWLSIRGHEHLSLVDIKKVSALPPSAALFNSLVVFENYRFPTRLRQQGGAWEHREFRLLENTGFPLSFLVYGDDALVLNIEYASNRFCVETIDQLLGEVTSILSAWSEDVTGPVWRTPILSPIEEQRVLRDWNATAMAYPRDGGLVQLIEDQVERSPDAVAVAFGEERLTYRDLNERANRMARALISRGAGPDRLIGICLQRSAAMLVAMLAVAKAGAAYLPLDPHLPVARRAYMMDDSELAMLITQEKLRADLPPYPGPVLSIDGPSADDDWQANSAENVRVAASPEQLAYVIYTSGSTGKPKGVEIRRGSLLNFLWSMREWLELDAEDRVLAVTTISFDIAGLEIWLPWVVGAQIVLATREQAADGDQLMDLIARHAVTFLQATPVTWRLLLHAGWTGDPNMQIVCGGEAMPPELAHKLAPIVGRVWNLYGPTETTVWSAGFRVTPDPGPILIGRPIGNTQCYILDEHYQPVPLGAAGELYIAGDGLARGYLKRPELTAEKFVANPFMPGTRMYRTGDLARFHPDGNIECLGRTDDQVKIRGFRIELGEIQSLLAEYPGVGQAVVVARESTPGETKLVAYLVPERDLIAANDLRAYMKAHLPEYMVPATYVSLPEMPLTPNGKVDKKALPAPETEADPARGVAVAPRTYVEKQLSEIWEELFALPAISVEDDFFELGGHSLLALSMMTKITQVFGERLPLNALFESPTIAKLATHIQRHQKTLGQHTLVSIQASGTRPPIFWIPGGAALGLFRLRHLVTRFGPDQPVYGLGSSHPKTLQEVESVEQRAANYLELVKQVQPHGPYCLAGFCSGGLVAYEMAQRLAAQGDPVAFVAMINCWFPSFPSGKVARLVSRLQQFQHKVRVARTGGTTLLSFLRQRRALRRAAQAERQALAAAKRQVSQQGFQEIDRSKNEVLLEATASKFEEYVPKPYAGRVSLFISNEEAAAGLSKRFDPRFAWAPYASAHEILEFPGGHGAVLEMPYAATFAETLKGALDAALE